MKTWFLSKWDGLQGTFWFVPMAMVLGAFVLSLLSLALDRTAAARGIELSLSWTFTRGPEGSRALLATVAGSMITIASVCFSITIVALQQASSQFGPRLLHNFMRDRGNQIVLGTFISGFTYCLLVLRTVNGTEDDRFVPHLSVTIGLLLALAGVAVLIYFIHHASKSIQAEHVIAGVSLDLHDALERLYPQDIGDGPSISQPEIKPPPKGLFEAAETIVADTSNYIQAVDGDRLMRLAVEHGLVLELLRRPGQFVIHGNAILRGVPSERIAPEVAAALRSAFFFGTRRTLLQDVEFAIDQLVEIAVRALSPGINDPFTAMSCVDRLGAALAEVAGKQFPSSYRYDEEEVLRVVASEVTASGIVDAAFHQIRQASWGNTAVTLRLLETIASLAPLVRSRDMRTALLAHAEVIHRSSQEALQAEVDRAEVRNRYDSMLDALAKKPDVPNGRESK